MYFEPNSDIRQVAQSVRQVFNAYLEVGFTEEQAMDLLKTSVMAAGSS